MKKLFFILLILCAANLAAQPTVDIDLDDDGLIEVSNFETLDAIRYQLDGSGLRMSADAEKVTSGCAVGGCRGYELIGDLDFLDAASYKEITNQKLWTSGAGWQPIGDSEHPFNAVFKTNNSSTPHTIFNLRINRSDEDNVGLFGNIGNAAEISGIGLLDAQVTGRHRVGGLVGVNVGGRVSNSYASGRVVGTGGVVALLVGSNSGAITNSYADGEVSGKDNSVGGLVGLNSGNLSNSYAMGSVVGEANNVGGLVGDNSQGTISNSYASANVSGSEDIGGLVGLSNLGTLVKNYVSGKATGIRYVGGLVGMNIGGTVSYSYWDKTTSALEGNSDGVGLSASELQSASAQNDDLTKPFYQWSTADWDFGSDEQYPILKYATGTDAENPACGPKPSLPNCGSLLLGQHASLKRILLLADASLTPRFKPTRFNYHLNIIPAIKQLQLVPIANNPNSVIDISNNRTAIATDMASGTTSTAIPLDSNTQITIEISAPNQRPAHYRLTVNYLPTLIVDGVLEDVMDEGRLVILDAYSSSDTEGEPLSYQWTQSVGKAIALEETDQPILIFRIPEDYVSEHSASAELGITVAVSDSKATASQAIRIDIRKIDNGTLPVAAPTPSVTEWTAPEIDLADDPDGVGSNLQYQWQSRTPDEDAEWTDIDRATQQTYTPSILTAIGTEYRVRIRYTDGQGYETTLAGDAATYQPEIVTLDFAKAQATEAESPPATSTATTTEEFKCDIIKYTEDIDDDGDGLIDICDLEGLNAMRYQPDGTGYKANAGATKITTGCPTGGCKGYELMRDLDFWDENSYKEPSNRAIWTGKQSWQPLGDNERHFTAQFDGNNHMISNLKVHKLTEYYLGLFGVTGTDAEISNIELSNVDVIGDGRIGGLVGINYGKITNSRTTGKLSAAIGYRYYSGGLVGRNYGSILNSYSTIKVVGRTNVGGLVGLNNGVVINSYATGNIVGRFGVGGLVGRNTNSITNSYALGNVSGRISIGGLVGHNQRGSISASYAHNRLLKAGDHYAGGLVGANERGTITRSYAVSRKIKAANPDRARGLVGFKDGGSTSYSYWDIDTSKKTISDGGTGKTTIQLQTPITPGTAPTDVYYGWSSDDWHFGTAEQYPTLKYTKGSDADHPACLPVADDELGLPECNSIIPTVGRPGLEKLTLVAGYLSPQFIPTTPKYKGAVVHHSHIIRLIPTALDPEDNISIKSTTQNEVIESGATSYEITLNEDGITTITLVVMTTYGDVPYNLSLRYHHHTEDIDQDDDGLIEIRDFEGLNAMRHQLDGSGYRENSISPKITVGCPNNDCKGYELVASLDFNKPGDYVVEANGWRPIGVKSNGFRMNFEGNGHTISNLWVDRPRAEGVGLFGYVLDGGFIRNIGMVNVSIKGGAHVGGLVGENRGGRVMNSYATGKVEGAEDKTGGLVGANILSGQIINSYADVEVKGGRQVGGLAGASADAFIMDSYATGSVEGSNTLGGLVGYVNRYRIGEITNSYAIAKVSDGSSGVGGLIGRRWGGHRITSSYWDKDTSGRASSAGGSGKTTEQLQTPTVATGIYSSWDIAKWDFGTAQHYPALKYAEHCGTSPRTTCGTLLPAQYPSLLDALAVSTGTLVPTFNPETFNYDVEVNFDVDTLTLHTTATGASIRISSNLSPTAITDDDSIHTTMPLTIADTTVITIEVTTPGQRPAEYQLHVSHRPGGKGPDIPPPEARIDNGEKVKKRRITISEGQKLEVSFANIDCDFLTCDWYIDDAIQSLLPNRNSTNTFTLNIPDGFFEPNESGGEFDLKFAARNNVGTGKAEDITLTINKKNNGPNNIALILDGRSLSVPEINDPDRGVATAITYQWQRKERGNNWGDITGEAARTYTISTKYAPSHRVRIRYTDGQGYGTEIYSHPIRNIDVDDDGLIEIKYLDELDAIRHQLDGTGYKEDDDADADKVTTGCPDSGCKGYELVADLDFKNYMNYKANTINEDWTTGIGWEPIGIDDSFSSILKGNGHTISNLMIDTDEAYVGLFFMISKGAVIDGIDLYRINIIGGSIIGGLVAKNVGGMIINSSLSGDHNATVNSIEGGGAKIGGLIGINENGYIINSYAVADIRGKTRGRTAGTRIGGLIGQNEGWVINSYADGSVTANKHLGGLVGWNEGSISNSYAISKVMGNGDIGNLVGSNNGVIKSSYWEINNNNIADDDRGTSKTTVELQLPTTATGIYEKWNGNVWDFGTKNQYPALKYANIQCTGEDEPAYCSDLSEDQKTFLQSLCTKEDAPAYCRLLPGQRFGLQSLELNNAILIEDFDNKIDSYEVLVGNETTSTTIIPVAANPNAEIKLIIGNSNEEIIGGKPHLVGLADNSTLTIVVTDGRSERSYTLNIIRFGILIDITGGMEYNEGATVTLKAEIETTGLATNFEDSYQWRGDLFATTTTELKFKPKISATYVIDNGAEATVELTVSRILRGQRIESRATKILQITQIDNGSITALGPVTVDSQWKLTAPELLMNANNGYDPEGIEANSISYQWQRRQSAEAEWEPISGATDKTYAIPETTPAYTRYRVSIDYKDIEGNEIDVHSDAYIYKVVDRDGNGWINIYTAEQLNAIRYQPDGSGYRLNATTTASTSLGCPVTGCEGYELKAHIDLSKLDGDWQPLGSDVDRFNVIFEGNRYTISNVTITTATDYVGLFAATSANAEIRNVGLLNVNIINANNYVGGLVGHNRGTIAYSHVVGKSIAGASNVGALIGFNDSDNVGDTNYAKMDALTEGTTSVCKLIGNYGEIESNKLLGSYDDNGLFQCLAPE